ncbi:MAG: hypothetical protein AAFN11_00410 [Chloroflexota bacterium]
MIVVFIAFFLVWLGALYFILQKQDLVRLFGFMMSSVLLYLSLELTLWSFNLPLPVMLVVGLIPLVCVLYGFRVYDYNRQRELEKRKNDDKLKNPNAEEGVVA